MKRRSITRTLALLSSVIMLSGEVMPVFAAGTDCNDPQAVEVVAEDDAETVGEETVSEDVAVSGNEAEEIVSENEAETISENDTTEESDTEENGPEEKGEDIPDEDNNVKSSKPAGTAVATAQLGDNVTGSIYNEGGKVVLYIDGNGSVVKTKFAESALKDYNITDLRFGGNVSTINDNIFIGNKTLERIVFSPEITSIGGYTFKECSALKEITFEKGGGELKIGWNAFARCTSLNNVILPARTASRIGEWEYSVFSGCESLTNAGLEEGSLCIPENAFSRATALKTVSIPSSVKSIGGHAFYNCEALTDFTIPENVQSIGDYAFSKSGITRVSIPGSVTEIGGYTYKNCESLSQLTFETGKGELKIGWNAFAYCTKLDNVTLPARTANKIGEYEYSVFSGCTSLVTAAMEAGSTYIPANAFSRASSLKNITIPSTVKKVGDHAFDKCSSLSDISLPKDVNYIGSSAFSGCTSIQSFVIPNKVKIIEMYGFAGCTMMTEVTLPSSITEVKYEGFYKCDRLAKVYCSKDKKKIKIGDLNEPLVNAEWIKTSGKSEPKTGSLTLDGNKVNSLAAAFKQMKDKDKEYVIELQSDLIGEKNLTIPKTAKSVRIIGNGHVIEMNGSKLTSNVPLTLTDVRFRAVSKKGELSKFTLNAKSSLTISRAVAFEAKSTVVRAGDKIALIGRLDAGSVSCKELDLAPAAVLVAVKGCKIKIKNKISGSTDSSIFLEEGYKPISLGGTAEGKIKITGAKQADGTQILKTSAKKINEDTLKAVFDVSGIKTSAIGAHLYYYNGKACIFSDAISFNGKTYGVWKTAVADMNTAQKAAKKDKAKASFNVTLNGDVNMMGKFLLPGKGYESITINGGGHALTFTSDITLTGNTTIAGCTLKKVNKKGKQVKGKVKKGKFSYSGPEEF